MCLSIFIDNSLKQMDVKTACLNAAIEEDVVIKKPEGFEIFDESGKSIVCKMKKKFEWFGTIWKQLVFDSEGFRDYT